MRVLVLHLPPNILVQRVSQLAQVFEHHLLKAQVAAVQKERDETGVKPDGACVVLHSNHASVRV